LFQQRKNTARLDKVKIYNTLYTIHLTKIDKKRYQADTGY